MGKKYVYDPLKKGFYVIEDGSTTPKKSTRGIKTGLRGQNATALKPDENSNSDRDLTFRRFV